MEKAWKMAGRLFRIRPGKGKKRFPLLFMLGYTTLVLETLDKMQAMGVEKPTHLLLQAGVGCFAGAILGFFMSVLGEDALIFYQRSTRGSQLFLCFCL